MIRYLNGDQLLSFPKLKRTMHLDRADQFFRRLGWKVELDENGEERDEYDALNPLYVILEDSEGNHSGSMRFLPTVGRTMVNEHFLDVTKGVEIRSPFIWECTRFCLSRGAERKAAIKLMVAGAYLMKESSIDHFVGVFDERMERVYNLVGASPTIIGRQPNSNGVISVGLWEFNESSYTTLCKKAGFTTEEFSQYLYPFAISDHKVSVPDVLKETSSKAFPNSGYFSSMAA